MILSNILGHTIDENLFIMSSKLRQMELEQRFSLSKDELMEVLL